MIGGSGTGIALNDFPTRSPTDPRHVLYQALRQVADLCAGIGDDLLALAVIELLSYPERLGSWPAEAQAAEVLQLAVRLASCRFSSTRTLRGPSKPLAALTMSWAISRRT